MRCKSSKLTVLLLFVLATELIFFAVHRINVSDALRDREMLRLMREALYYDKHLEI